MTTNDQSPTPAPNPAPWIEPCPEWCMWQATDSDGRTYGSDIALRLSEIDEMEWVSDGRIINLGKSFVPPADFRTTLVQRPTVPDTEPKPEVYVPDIAKIAPGHNPDQLAVGQVGEGWRLVDEDEVHPGARCVPMEAWWPDKAQWTALHYFVASKHITYRTRLTRAELRAARGLEPEPPSLAHEFIHEGLLGTAREAEPFPDEIEPAQECECCKPLKKELLAVRSVFAEASHNAGPAFVAHEELNRLRKENERLAQAQTELASMQAERDAAVSELAQARAERDEPRNWKYEEDQSLAEDAEIEAAHPVNADTNETYGESMRMVGAKRSKAALVALVNMLLVRIRDAQERAPQLERERDEWAKMADEQRKLGDKSYDILREIHEALHLDTPGDEGWTRDEFLNAISALEAAQADAAGLKEVANFLLENHQHFMDRTEQTTACECIMCCRLRIALSRSADATTEQEEK